MYRDATDVSGYDCIVLVDDKTLKGYNQDGSQTFKLISNKYRIASTDPNDKPDISQFQCYDQSQISQFESPYDFMTPIYHTMGIASFLAIIVIVYVIFLRPFFRSKI